MQTSLNILNFHSLDEINLWGDIENYEIDDLESSFKFSHRLARENMWSESYTRRVIDEYKKFMFLGVSSSSCSSGCGSSCGGGCSS